MSREEAKKRAEAIKGLQRLSKEFNGYKPNEEMFEIAIEALKEQKIGKWNLCTDEKYDVDYYVCSNCGYEPYRKMDISNYCPNCGAKMEVME